VRAFDNDSIAQLHAVGVETGNLGAPDTNALAANSVPQPAEINSLVPNNSAATKNETLMAQNQPPALPQSDQPTPAPRSTAAQQRHQPVDQGNVDPAGASASSSEQVPSSQAATNQPKLPQSASPLPLLLLVVALGF